LRIIRRYQRDIFVGGNWWIVKKRGGGFMRIQMMGRKISEIN